MLCFPSNLTPQEEQARDIMVYLFNPVLKFIFLTQNYVTFRKYGFNSCRQTAILGAGYLRKLLPDYTIRVCEGQFLEHIDGKFTPYVHAFILAGKDERTLIIDLSRTEKRLLFTQAYPGIYPTTEDYKDMVLINFVPIDLDEMLNTNEPEFISGYIPRQLMEAIEGLIAELKELPEKEQLKFCDEIYSETTKLRR